MAGRKASMWSGLADIVEEAPPTSSSGVNLGQLNAKNLRVHNNSSTSDNRKYVGM